MKNYNQFIDNQNDKLNEEFIKKLISKISDKLGKLIGNTPGGEEVEKIYNEYKIKLETEIKKIAGVDLQSSSAKNESTLLRYNNFINEDLTTDMDEDTEVDTSEKKDKSLTREALLKKSKLLNQKLELILKEATKKMEGVLKEKGGKEKNEKLSELIELKKDTLRMDFLNMQLTYVEKSGDKDLIKKTQIERDNKNKEIENRFNKINSMGEKTDKEDGTFKVGKRYQYKTDSGELKIIKILGNSEEVGKIKATYIDEDNEQNFTTDNIMKSEDITIDKNKKYKYYSMDNKSWIDVTIEDEKPTGDIINVKGKKDPFKVNKNTLIPI